MIYTLVSPGIWRASFEGFVVTKIEGAKKVNGFDCRGHLQTITEYNYIAIKPGPPAPIRFAGNDIDKIKQQILSLQQTALF